MKTLIVHGSSVGTSDISLLLKREFVKAGCEVTFVDNQGFNKMGLMETILRRIGLHPSRLSLILTSRKIYKMVKKMDVKLVLLYGSNNNIRPKYIQKMKKKLGVKVILWEVNMQIWKRHQINAFKLYDHIFLLDSYLIPLFKNMLSLKSVHHLSGACVEEEHRVMELDENDKEKYGSDIAFIGSPNKERIALFEHLKDYDFKIYGQGWKNISSLKDLVIEEPVYGYKKAKVYNASKIIINLQNASIQVYAVSCRIFEVLACGSLPITEYRKELDDMYKIGEEIVVYYDEKDLIDKVNYYLNNEKERLEIIKKGRERTLKNHSYKNRVEKILKVVGE